MECQIKLKLQITWENLTAFKLLQKLAINLELTCPTYSARARRIGCFLKLLDKSQLIPKSHLMVKL